MQAKQLHITGYSTALFSTWIFVEELGLLFDAGDGVSAGLLQKSRKIRQVFISHADRDHVMGLFQLNQLNAREGFPVVYYPADCGSFPAMEEFAKQFDPQVKKTTWNAISGKEEIRIRDGVLVKAVRNNHISKIPEQEKSLSYQVFQTKRKLKAAYRDLDHSTIQQLVEKEGRNALTEEVAKAIIGYSGDTPVENYERWDNTKILIHESTFLDDQAGVKEHRNKHSRLEEVIKMAAEINIEQLILIHFSPRYSKEEIDDAIKRQCKKYGIDIPVFRILPGEIERDMLSSQAVNA